MQSVFFGRWWNVCGSTAGVVPVLALFLVGCANLQPSPDSSKQLQLTPIVSSPTDVYHPGKFVWHDLLTPDVDAASKFYGGLFGWTFEQRGSYTLVMNQGRQVGGMVEIKPEAGKAGEAVWLAYLSVSDVDAAVDYLKSAGGKFIRVPLIWISAVVGRW